MRRGKRGGEDCHGIVADGLDELEHTLSRVECGGERVCECVYVCVFGLLK